MDRIVGGTSLYIGPYILMLMNFFLPNPVDLNQIDPADSESISIMASLIIENHENTSSILFSEFEKYSQSGSKSDELEKFSEFKVTGILSCFFKAIGKNLSRNTMPIYLYHIYMQHMIYLGVEMPKNELFTV